MTKNINLTLKIWRQKGSEAAGTLESFEASDISTDMSFLEMLDVVNERLTLEGREPIAFDHDCREGICGTCGAVVNGRPHGPQKGTTLCQLHMRHFADGDTLVIEPWRARAFKVIKDLVVDRSALDKMIQVGGYISASTGGAPDANAIPIAQETADLAGRRLAFEENLEGGCRLGAGERAVGGGGDHRLQVIAHAGTFAVSRKFCNSWWPCSEAIDSGWNCTP